MPEKEGISCSCIQSPRCCDLLKCRGIYATNSPIKELIINTIKGFRKLGKTYAEIGKRLKISSGQVLMIENGKWYPKSQEGEAKIIWELKGGEDGGRTE
jgi:hypothetical protein